MVGGGEVLRDEQIFLAHKCANPTKYAPPTDALTEEAKMQLARFPPTPVQLQVWDDLCHVAPTLSFTRPAKYMYRSVAQFSAWALARAQSTSILIPDDNVSIISESNSDSTHENTRPVASSNSDQDPPGAVVGKAGDSLPPFRDNMIRQRVTRHGVIFPLEPESKLPGCTLKPHDVGVVKSEPVRRWLETRQRWDARYSKVKRKVHEQMAREMAEGYLAFSNGETPPPSALAGRRRSPAASEGWTTRKRKSVGLALWGIWGSAHDKIIATQMGDIGEEPSDAQGEAIPEKPERPRGLSYRGVTDENQTGEGSHPSDAPLDRETSALSGTTFALDKETTAPYDRRGTVVEDLLRERKEKEEIDKKLLGPEHAVTGVAGRRPTVDGVAVPFALRAPNTATSSLLTLNSEEVGSKAAEESRRSADIGSVLSRPEDSLKGADAGSVMSRPEESSKGVEVERPGSRVRTAEAVAGY